MNILYSAPDQLVPGFTGGAAHATSVIKALREEGHKVFLICTESKDLINDPDLLKDRGIIRFEIKNQPNVIRKNFDLFFKSLSIAFLLRNKIDLIYERGRIFGGGAVLIGWLFGKPIIYEMNEPLEGNKIFLKEFIKNWNKSIMQKATLITGMHKSFFKDAPKDKYIIITNAADPDIFSPKVKCDHIIRDERYKLTQGKTIFYSGSFAPWHACENMIEIAKKLVRKDKKIKFLMVGYGKKYDICNNLIKKYNLQKNVFLIGKISYLDMPAYVNATDICLALFDRNYHEYKDSGYYYSPVKLFEYLGCGKPVVASDIGNIKQLITNKNGILIDESKIDDIVIAIQKLMRNKSTYTKISKNNRRLILEKYNWRAINQNILNELAKRSRVSLSN